VSDNRKNLGSLGEKVASLILQKHNYKVLARNYRNRFGEVDLIAIDGDTLVFVEVKLRSSLHFGLPEEAVTERKIERIKKVGSEFWMKKYPHIKKLRVDIVSIQLHEGKFLGKIIKCE
jgi:putative endonuclease